ncbi:MAG TPA: hypothetical protein VIG47_14465 [Gemmatimonadaceae bacterium]|jgi:hypothetical protein
MAIRNRALYIKNRVAKIPFSGRVGFILSLVYAALLASYPLTQRKPDNRSFEHIIHSPLLFVWIVVYLGLAALSLWRVVRGSTLATTFIGVQGIVSSLHPFDATAIVLIAVWAVFPILAVHGMIEWFERRPGLLFDWHSDIVDSEEEEGV